MPGGNPAAWPAIKPIFQVPQSQPYRCQLCLNLNRVLKCQFLYRDKTFQTNILQRTLSLTFTLIALLSSLFTLLPSASWTHFWEAWVDGSVILFCLVHHTKYSTTVAFRLIVPFIPCNKQIGIWYLIAGHLSLLLSNLLSHRYKKLILDCRLFVPNLGRSHAATGWGRMAAATSLRFFLNFLVNSLSLGLCLILKKLSLC